MEDNKPKLEREKTQTSINQYSEPDDYFSFFSSHEKLILRPEKTYKHMRNFIKYYWLEPSVVNHSSFRSPRTNFRVVHHKERYLTRQTFVLCGEPLESSSVMNENSSGSPRMAQASSIFPLITAFFCKRTLRQRLNLMRVTTSCSGTCL